MIWYAPEIYTNSFRLLDAGDAFALSILPTKVSSWIFSKMRKPELMPDNLVNLEVNTIIDWDGCCLSPEVLKLLRIGCVVRLAVRNTNTDEKSMIYFRILEMQSDGTVWGKALDIYRTKRRSEKYGYNHVMPNGSVHAFTLDNIAEIPIMWQPRAIRRRLDSFRTDESYAITGLGALGQKGSTVHTNGENTGLETPDKSHPIDDTEKAN